MGDLFYALAIILVIIWAVAFFGFNAGALIHLLWPGALVSIALRLFMKPRTNAG